jgi:methylglutaconyl-CoA hydratase
MPYIQSETTPSGICTITFFHEAHNSLPGNLLNDLAKTILNEGSNPLNRVLILKSGGDKTFCAGASFNELITIEDLETGRSFFSGFAKVINACRTCGKIIIGRVQGKAIGGGVGLAAAVDYCLATSQASIKLSELAVGIGPFVVGPAVQRKIGLSAFSQLTLDATEFQSASWARKKGLYANIFETTQELDSAVMELAEKLASSNPEALALLKQIFWEGTEHWDKLLVERAGMSGHLVLSEFTKSALASYSK